MKEDNNVTQVVSMEEEEKELPIVDMGIVKNYSVNAKMNKKDALEFVQNGREIIAADASIIFLYKKLLEELNVEDLKLIVALINEVYHVGIVMPINPIYINIAWGHVRQFINDIYIEKQEKKDGNS